MLATLGLAALALSGCSSMPDIDLSWMPSFTPVDRRPASPPVAAVRRDGLSGELLNGPAPPVVPDEDVDAVIGSAIRAALTAAERRQLAEASQRAAAEITGTPVLWDAVDGDRRRTASGAAVPVADAYRSVRGRICRDVRQAVNKGETPRLTQVTLCREDRGSGLYVWLVGQGDQ
jgi:surface antigen